MKQLYFFDVVLVSLSELVCNVTYNHDTVQICTSYRGELSVLQ